MRNCESTWPADSLLRTFYLAAFRPAARLSRKRLQVYDSAVRRLERFAGGEPRLGAVDRESLVAFAAWLPSRRCAPKYAKQLVGCIREIVRAWNDNALSPDELPPAEPGTIRHYFEQIYCPEAMVDAKPASIGKTRRAMIALRKFHGGDVRFDELSDSLAAGFFRSLLDNGMPAVTINSGYRATWFAVWNHAADRGLVARGPRVKKLKEIREEPDAWSLAELKRILAAAERFRPGEHYGELPCGRLWHALLLTAWSTGLRRGSLLAIRRRDVDLATGLVYVAGEQMKNRRAQSFQLCPEALEAIGRIWLPERDRLFVGLSSYLLNRHFALILAAANVPPSRRKGLNKFHCLRRTTATAIASRAGVAAASALLGHSDHYVTGRYLDPRKLPGHNAAALLPSLAAG
jgi:integrase